MYETLETDYGTVNAKLIGEDSNNKLFLDNKENFYLLKKPSCQMIGSYKATKISKEIIDLIKEQK